MPIFAAGRVGEKFHKRRSCNRFALADVCTERNPVEQLINKLKAWRDIATCCDKIPGGYLAGLHLRSMIPRSLM